MVISSIYEASKQSFTDSKSETRMAALSLLATLWEFYPEELDVNEVLEINRKAGNDFSLILRFGGVSILFKVLDMLIS